MLDQLNNEDKEFILYLLAHLPVGYLYMEYQDYTRAKQPTPITNSDVNRLDLQLSLYRFSDLIKE